MLGLAPWLKGWNHSYSFVPLHSPSIFYFFSVENVPIQLSGFLFPRTLQTVCAKRLRKQSRSFHLSKKNETIEFVYTEKKKHKNIKMDNVVAEALLV